MNERTASASPLAPSDPQDKHARKREKCIAEWVAVFENWDWVPITWRALNESEFKLGNRRSLIHDTAGEDWYQGLSAPDRWVEEFCFDQALAQVAQQHKLSLRIDNHAFWVSTDDR